MSTQSSQAAREAAIKAVRSALGLSDTPSDWTYAQRVEYNKTLANYMLNNPEKFDDSTLNIAEQVSKSEYSALEDSSFDFGMFAAETVKPITQAAQSVGQGVFSVANMAKWLLPLLALVAAFVLLNKYTGGAVVDTAKQVAAPKRTRKPRAAKVAPVAA